MQFFRDNIGNITSWAKGASQILGLTKAVEISAMILDQERFSKKPSSGNAWNLAIQRNNDLYLEAAKELLPHAKTFYYFYGGFGRSAASDGWSQSNWFTLNEQTDIYSTSLYTIPEIGYQREAL